MRVCRKREKNVVLLGFTFLGLYNISNLYFCVEDLAGDIMA